MNGKDIIGHDGVETFKKSEIILIGEEYFLHK